MLLTRLNTALKQHRYFLGAVAVVMLVSIWMVTYGTGELLDREIFGQFYDAQAASLLAGRWDVAREAIFPEGFYRDGRVYGYFGFVPALPRMLLNALFPAMAGNWSRLSVCAGVACTLICCHRILARARQWFGSTVFGRSNDIANGTFILLAGLGASTIYIASCSFVYHEAIIWAVVLALACYEQLLGYLIDGRGLKLVAACVFAFLCFFCRISTGCGPCFTLLLIGVAIVACRVPKLPGMAWLRRWHRGSSVPSNFHVVIIGGTLLVILGTYAAINHAKFGDWFDPAPMRLHEQVFSQPGRLQRTDGKWMRLGNIPTTAYAYLSPGSIMFVREFPWVSLQWNLRSFPGQRMDSLSPSTSVTASMPVFVLLAIIGISFVVRSGAKRQNTPTGGPCLILIGALGGIAPLLPFCFVDNRYLHDFLPFLVIASALGLHALLVMRHGRLKTMVVIVLVLGGLFQIYVNCSFALVYQRLMVFSRPSAPDAQMRHWQRSINSLFTK